MKQIKILESLKKFFKSLRELDPYKYDSFLYFWNNDKTNGVFYIEDDAELITKLRDVCIEHKEYLK